MKYLRKHLCSDGGIVTYDSEKEEIECTKCGIARSFSKGTIPYFEKHFKLLEKWNPSSRNCKEGY